MADADLLVTYDPSREGKAKTEIEAMLSKAGAKAKFLKSDVDGVFLLQVGKAKDVVKKLVSICKKNPGAFEATFHYVPIEEWVNSDVKKMQAVTKKLGAKIKKEERWKMNLNKRHYEGDTRQLIVKLTEPIDKPNVDLADPQKIVQVEIIGKKAGLSLLETDELLIVPRMKG